jgi:hypothetical protein
MFHITTKFGERWGKGLYHYEDDKDFSFDSITRDSNKLTEFISKFKEDMAAHYSCITDRIIIQEIVRGSILVKFYYEAGVPDGQDIYSKSEKRHLKGRLIKEKSLFEALELSEEDLDSDGDIDFFQQYVAEEQVRGYFPYFQAPGWIRYGLDVKKFGE